jgi:hypothetical protein
MLIEKKREATHLSSRGEKDGSRRLYYFSCNLHFPVEKGSRYYETRTLVVYKTRLPLFQSERLTTKFVSVLCFVRRKGKVSLRLPDSMTSALEGGRLSAIHTGRL